MIDHPNEAMRRIQRNTALENTLGVQCECNAVNAGAGANGMNDGKRGESNASNYGAVNAERDTEDRGGHSNKLENELTLGPYPINTDYDVHAAQHITHTHTS